MSQTRRQNSACDQCRNRKVKCNIQPGEDKCQHCVNKNYQCTFIAQQETEKKRSVTGRRLVRNSPPNMPLKLPPGYHQYRPPNPEYLGQDGSSNLAGREDYGMSNTRASIPPPTPSSSSGMPYVMDPALQQTQSLPNISPTSPHSLSAGPIPSPWPPSRATSQLIQDRARLIPTHPAASQYPHNSRSSPVSSSQYSYPGLPPPPSAPIQDFLAYLFAPDPAQPIELTGQTQEYMHARRRLQEPDYRIEFATELLEVYFQVYHPRVPIVNPTRLRAQFREALYGTPKDRNGVNGGSADGPPPSKRMRSGEENGIASANSSFTESIASTISAASTNATPTPPLRPIHRPLLACLLAWGSKFSDHALLVMDRQQVSRETTPTPLRSNISRLLVDRAREVAEQEKVFRIAKPENVVVCLLLEPVQPLQSYDTVPRSPDPPTDPQGLKCLWLNAGIRHLIELGVNHHPSNPIPAGQHTGDPDDWSCMVFCWWIVCVSDALCSLYFKKKPCLSEDDYDLKEFKLVTQPPVLPFATGDSDASDLVKERAAAQEHAFMLWYSSAHDLAVCSRELARTMWRPNVLKWGIPYEVITQHIAALTKWRDDHLALVGANNDLQNIGDYVAAVTACTIDCSYHVMWISLSLAISDYGIREINAVVDPAHEGATGDKATPHESTSSLASHSNGVLKTLKDLPAEVSHMIEVERVVATEAFKSATRIAGLAGVLTSNGYMRLDPNAMHWPIYSAGRLLAQLGRQEVSNCIDGLNQNGYAYDESWTHAKELQSLYTVAAVQGPKDAEALLHPYMNPNARAARVPPPPAYKTSTVYETFKQNVDAPYADEGLKRKHSPIGDLLS